MLKVTEIGAATGGDGRPSISDGKLAKDKVTEKMTCLMGGGEVQWFRIKP